MLFTELIETDDFCLFTPFGRIDLGLDHLIHRGFWNFGHLSLWLALKAQTEFDRRINKRLN